MKAIFCGAFTGTATVKILSKHFSTPLNRWLYLCRSTSRTNRFYKTGETYYFDPRDLHLKIRYQDSGNTIIKSGFIDRELIPTGEPLLRNYQK